MKIGFGLITGQRYPGDEREPAQLYAEALELAQAAEAAGLDSVWTSEHHFVDDGYMPSLLVLSAAMAAVTRNITIGTGVLLAPLYHPLRLAEDVATVDLISKGRFILGLGLGWRAEEFDRLGVPNAALGRRTSETIRILRRSWAPGPFRFDGEIFRIGPTNVTPKPIRPVPIWLGGRADAAVRRAGRLADAFFGSTVPLEDYPRLENLAREGLRQAERDPAEFTFALLEPVWASEDPGGDIDQILRHYWYVRWKYGDMALSEGRPENPLPEVPPLDDRGEAHLRSQLIVGTPEQVAERIRAFGSAIGEGGHFVARSYFPGVPMERMLRTIELLGEVKRLVT